MFLDRRGLASARFAPAAPARPPVHGVRDAWDPARSWACLSVFVLALLALRFAPLGSPARPVPSFAPLRSRLPFVDVVVLVPSPWKWASRRVRSFETFVATARRAAPRFTAKLIFVMGDDAVPANLSASDAQMVAHPDVLFVTARGCPDLDTIYPGAWDGGMFPPANSSTTCKVLEGAVAAAANFRFRYFARAGDDAYLRWDYFLGERAANYPNERLYLGYVNAGQGVFDHLYGVFGMGRFLPYMTGQGWVLTYDVALLLADGYQRRPRLSTAGPEDAAVALHLFPFNIVFAHTEDFHDPTKRACDESSILVHYVTDEMVCIGQAAFSRRLLSK